MQSAVGYLPPSPIFSQYILVQDRRHLNSTQEKSRLKLQESYQHSPRLISIECHVYKYRNTHT